MDGDRIDTASIIKEAEAVLDIHPIEAMLADGEDALAGGTGMAIPPATNNTCDGDGNDDDDDDDESIVFNVPVEFRITVKAKLHELGMESDEIEEWGVDHVKLLYMLSKYARAALTQEEEEGWCRELPLSVLMYEGVVAGVLDFDYAPCSKLVSQDGSSRRIWLNITQEGRAAIDDMREKELLNGLKLSTEDFQPVTAYQVSAKGMVLVEQMPQELKDEVDAFTHAEEGLADGVKAEVCAETMLLVSLDAAEGEFQLSTTRGYKKPSLITDTEDVSYVSSPYLPACIRGNKPAPFTDNSHRAHESATGDDNIRDELSEAITLSGVQTLVAEWIPFGANQIVGLNERLGALDRCQGGFFTSMVDENPTDTKMSVPQGNTNVKILDFDFVRFINFEADINYAEDEGIVQVENFGMHLNVDGTIIYGMKIEAIMDRLSDDTSVDHLSRLLVDVHQDSSQIMNDLLSQYQCSLLDMIFSGDTENRGKYNMIVADTITPDLPAENYIDRSEREQELQQVLGQIQFAYKLGSKEGEQDTLLLGREGALLAGPNSKRSEELLMKMFIRNFFNRTFMLDDLINRIRALVSDYRSDPLNIKRIRAKLNDANRDIILLHEVLGYLDDSMREMSLPDSSPSADECQKQLYAALDLKTMYHDVQLRVTDLKKLVHGAQNKLELLQGQTQAITTKVLEDTVRNIEANYRKLVDASNNEKASAQSVEIMEIIFSGGMAFTVIDRIDGNDILGFNGVAAITPDIPFLGSPIDWVQYYIRNQLCEYPFVWFVSNMAFLLAFVFVLKRYMGSLQYAQLRAQYARVQVNKKISLKQLYAYIGQREIIDYNSVQSVDEVVVTVQYMEDNRNDGAVNNFTAIFEDKVKVSVAERVVRWLFGIIVSIIMLPLSIFKIVFRAGKDNSTLVWKGEAPKVKLIFDAKQGFLLTMNLQWNEQRNPLSSSEMEQLYLRVLKREGVLIYDEKAEADKKRARTLSRGSDRGEPEEEDEPPKAKPAAEPCKSRSGNKIHPSG